MVLATAGAPLLDRWRYHPGFGIIPAGSSPQVQRTWATGALTRVAHRIGVMIRSGIIDDSITSQRPCESRIFGASLTRLIQQGTRFSICLREPSQRSKFLDLLRSIRAQLATVQTKGPFSRFTACCCSIHARQLCVLVVLKLKMVGWILITRVDQRAPVGPIRELVSFVLRSIAHTTCQQQIRPKGVSP